MAFPRFLWEVTIDASNDRLIFDEGGLDLWADIALGDYYLRGAGFPVSDLLAAVAVAMNAPNPGSPGFPSGNVYGVVVDTTGTVMIYRVGGPNQFSLHWATGGADTAAIGTTLGYSVAADDGPGVSFVSDYQHQYGWYPEKDLLDGWRRQQLNVGGALRSTGRQQYAQQWVGDDWRTEARIDYVPYTKIRYRDSDNSLMGGARHETITSNGEATWEGFWDAAARSVRFEFHPTVAVLGSYMTAVADPETPAWLEDLDAAASLLMERGERYRVVVPMRPYVA